MIVETATRTLEFKIPGKPGAKARARVGQGRVFPSKELVAYEAYVAAVATYHLQVDRWPDSPDCPIRVDCRYCFSLPDKLKKTRRVDVPGQYPGVPRKELKEQGIKLEKHTVPDPRWPGREDYQPHLATPDRDNLEKAVLDGLNKTTAWADDRCAYAGYGAKYWLPEGQTVGFTLVTLSIIEVTRG